MTINTEKIAKLKSLGIKVFGPLAVAFSATACTPAQEKVAWGIIGVIAITSWVVGAALAFYKPKFPRD